MFLTFLSVTFRRDYIVPRTKDMLHALEFLYTRFKNNIGRDLKLIVPLLSKVRLFSVHRATFI